MYAIYQYKLWGRYMYCCYINNKHEVHLLFTIFITVISYSDSRLNIHKMAVYLNPLLSHAISLDENDFQDIVQKTKDWTLMHGYY